MILLPKCPHAPGVTIRRGRTSGGPSIYKRVLVLYRRSPSKIDDLIRSQSTKLSPILPAPHRGRSGHLKSKTIIVIPPPPPPPPHALQSRACVASQTVIWCTLARGQLGTRLGRLARGQTPRRTGSGAVSPCGRCYCRQPQRLFTRAASRII